VYLLKILSANIITTLDHIFSFSGEDLVGCSGSESFMSMMQAADLGEKFSDFCDFANYIEFTHRGIWRCKIRSNFVVSEDKFHRSSIAEADGTSC